MTKAYQKYAPVGSPVSEIATQLRVGFHVLRAGFYPYNGNFAPGRLDGREIAAAIGVKAG